DVATGDRRAYRGGRSRRRRRLAALRRAARPMEQGSARHLGRDPRRDDGGPVRCARSRRDRRAILSEEPVMWNRFNVLSSVVVLCACGSGDDVTPDAAPREVVTDSRRLLVGEIAEAILVGGP